MLWLLWILVSGVVAEDSTIFPQNEETSQEGDPKTQAARPETTAGTAQETKEKPSDFTIHLRARADTLFVAGDPVAQGFSLASLGLGARGEVGSLADYGLLASQTREYSTALLPQLIPIEAFVRLGEKGEGAFPLTWKIGMFIPRLNPMWSRDLGDIELPDRHEIHRHVLLGPDVGTEITVQLPSINGEVWGGGFNGNGIISLNTNNCRGYHVGAEFQVDLSDVLGKIGSSFFSLGQSVPGAINYRSVWVWDVYASIEYHGFTLGGDALTGLFQDPSYTTSTTGFGAFVRLPLYEKVTLLARAEMLTSSPITRLAIVHWQLGPEVEIESNVKLFLIYDSLDLGTANNSSGQVRLRLAI